MKFLRRFLGILVMIAGILGLILSIAGLVGVWVSKPAVVDYTISTLDTLNNAVMTSQTTMAVTRDALGSARESVDALSVMLASTAGSVEASMPVFQKVNTLMSENLPGTLESAAGSLDSAQQAAVVLDSSIRSLESFQRAMSGVPLVSAFVETPTQAYNPEKPLAVALGEAADELKTLPPILVSMSEDLDRADDNLETVRGSLDTMSISVQGISQNLGEYDAMLAQSEVSLGNLAPTLAGIQANLPGILNGAALALTLFFLWLLAIQVVVLSQGWELFQGTAGRMEGGPTGEPASLSAG